MRTEMQLWADDYIVRRDAIEGLYAMHRLRYVLVFIRLARWLVP